MTNYKLVQMKSPPPSDHATLASDTDRMRPSITLHHIKLFCSDFRSNVVSVVQDDRRTHSICDTGERGVGPWLVQGYLAHLPGNV